MHSTTQKFNAPDTPESIYTPEELLLVHKGKIPRHIAIIPDGNRRWAKTANRSLEEGYRAGIEALFTCVRAAKELGIGVITTYTFSTENWLRPAHEIDLFMQLFELYLQKYLKQLLAHDIRLHAIGALEQLPSGVQAALHRTMGLTKECSSLDLVLAANYGGRNELARAMRKIALLVHEGQLTPAQIDEELIKKHLDTVGWPDPDLVIRTSGEQRLSNFLIWQTAYAEVYLDAVTWPSFTPKNLLGAVNDYQKRERRWGGDRKP